MRKMTAILLAAAFLFCGCQLDGTAEKEPQETRVVYSALPLPELYLEIPERFTTTSSEFYEEYYICEDASIIVTQDWSGAPYSSVYDYAIDALTEYQNITTELELLHNEQVEANSVTVQTLEFNSVIGEGDDVLRMTCMTGYLPDPDSMDIITCKCSTENYEGYRSDFLSVITSAGYLK